MMNSMANYMSRGHDLFQEEFLVRCNQNVIRNDVLLNVAKSCVCHVGELHSDDIVLLRDGTVAKVMKFWRSQDSFVVAQVLAMPVLHRASHVFGAANGPMKFVVVATQVMDACIYTEIQDGVFKVSLAF